MSGDNRLGRILLFQVRKVGDGTQMAGNGDPSGQRYQRSPNHASSWSSVAARVPAVDVVDVARSV
jgi:hypothetical protein